MLFPLALLRLISAANADWPVFGYDSRHTGQSEVRGPADADEVSAVPLSQGMAVNMPVSIDGSGDLYVGTWGVIRSDGETDRTRWDKLDGHLYKLSADLETLWRFAGDPVPYCYSYAERADTTNCPDGGEWNSYNGTVEGTAAIGDGVVYVGRGDGKLYAIDTETGEEIWHFTTFNPKDPEDPEGGGEIVTGPTLAEDGTLYFATVAVGPYETNALYAVSADGTLRWRYPSADKTLDNIGLAPLALSPDGQTLYAGMGFGPTSEAYDADIPGVVYAFDLGADGETGEAHLKWSYFPVNDAEWWAPSVWIFRVAVGADGRIYLGGSELTAGGGSAVVFALDDDGDAASPAWDSYVDVDRDEAAFVTGLALREEGGVTTAVLAGSGNFYALGYPSGGVLRALDPETGEENWTFDPEDHGMTGSLTGIAVDGAGDVYSGVSGALNGGQVFSVDDEGGLRWTVPLDGLLEWSQPVLSQSGAVYVADTRRCLTMFLPVETSGCDTLVDDPQVYRIDDRPGSKREACTCGAPEPAALSWVLLALFAVANRRRPGTAPRAG